MANGVDEDIGGFHFGPFRLAVNERLLTRDGMPVELGGRALDILIALVTAPNEIISKKDLMAQVWPDALVEEGSLRFHMTGLRKALGDGQGGARYIATVAGRGYCFVAPVAHAPVKRTDQPAATSHFPHANLPPRLGRMIGRDVDVMKLAAQLTDSRFVTIVGPGGVGKTTVAVAAAHQVADHFAGHVLFVDFSVIAEPDLAATSIASMLGLPVQAEDPTPDIVRFLSGKHFLLVLDTCEHLIEAIAAMVATILEAAPDVHVLATSREALRIEGERIYRLDALGYPPPDASGLSVSSIEQFPATQLFIERAMANGARLDVSDAEAAIVGAICRKLDGVALAIELAARRVEAYGLEQTAALLDQRLTLLWHGLRTAPPRQQTLQATLDWSYSLLSDLERTVLRRLAVFVGHFTLDAALEVVTNETLDRAAVFEAIDSLVEKSMVAARPLGAMMRYRLLDTTRAYALELCTDKAEWTELSSRHASYYRRWLEQNGSEWSSLSTGMERAPHFAALNNVRAALDWCFSERGDTQVGIGLAAAAAPVSRAMGLLTECHRWTERALQALNETTRGSSEEMQLQASLGVSMMFTRGHHEATVAALNRSFEIAEMRGDYLNAVRLIGPIYFYHLRSGEQRQCLLYAKRCADIAATLGDPSASALAHTLMGVSLCIMGELAGARTELETVLEPDNPPASRQIHYGFDHYSWAGIGWVTALWLQGHTDQMREAIAEAIREAEAMRHPVAFAIVINAVAALLWVGDLDLAEAHLNWFIARAETHATGPYLHMGNAFKAELSIRRGDIENGVVTLQRHLEKLHATRFELFTIRFHIVVATGLAATGRFAEAWTLAEEAAVQIEEKGYTSYLSELLRLRGAILRAAPELSNRSAEDYFTQSLDLSRVQGAKAWEIRAATDLSLLWAAQNRAADAEALLRPIFERLTEGRDTPDLRAAASVLAKLR
ncbi:putative ATPase/DNA-binding winged helix-turn-helix (wHTH) protein [Rhizobium sp. BK650]|uniref:ATP-binding protein n=1 Tax=Rhizobium sp. BK650 TaxID=2586990 RepID=UPI0017A34416|nr:winged helix-turn-helix domain-containing protein [Rhizobium sp. BK650]MBB3656840.1 putative ATPase/DNA-binding winged helix-turn-helix (wHTH) protein [Rhizobium sp. BK650]